MSEKILKQAKGKGISEVRTVKVKADGSIYDSDSGEMSSHKLFQAAAQLPEGSFLSIQAEADKEGSWQVTVFSSSGAAVTDEDFSWIFRKYGECCSDRPEMISDLFQDQRLVYVISNTSEDQGKQDVCKAGWDEIIDLGCRLKETGAVIRIIAEGGCKDLPGQGIALISLPRAMPLRLHAILSACFPFTRAVRLTEEGECLEEFFRPSTESLEEGLRCLLKSIWTEEHKAANIDDIDVDDAEPEDSTETSQAESGTPLEDLGLSVRSYNCLKRAGISSVEELKNMKVDELMHVRNLGRKGIEEIKTKLAELFTFSGPEPLTSENYRNRLEELIGLEDIKEQVKKITAFARMKKDLAEAGRDTVSMALNMEFTGNPGTAKTTVARILAGIFYEIGLLPSDELVETGRADLVGRYTGETAIKIQEIFKKAKGKVLFIDEAYALVEHWTGSYGDEAINTIVQLMENNRDDTIVIFAGYPKEMEAFFKRNPGLRSRVPFHLDFKDYSPEEMTAIVRMEAGRRGFNVQPEAEEKIQDFCETAGQDKLAGNGRFCRNLAESAILNYASRVYKDDIPEEKPDFTLASEDFTMPEILKNIKRPTVLGFKAS